MIIKASATLRNKYGEISKICHQSNEPVFITKNGEGDLVLMSIEQYEKMQEELKLLKELLNSESQIKNGNYFTHEEFKEKTSKLLKKVK